MAHGDYICCAVCDSRMAYDFDADAKTALCAGCAVDLALDGVVVRSPEALVAWVARTDAAKVQAVLMAHAFRFCRYDNAVDDAVRLKGLAPDKNRLGQPAVLIEEEQNALEAAKMGVPTMVAKKEQGHDA